MRSNYSTSAMEQDTLVPGRDAEFVANLFGTVPVQVSQSYHDALASRQLSQSLGDDVAHLARQRDLFRPLLRNLPPTTRVLLGRTLEPFRLDCWTGVLRGQAGERDSSSFADPATLRLVHQDPVHPGAQRGVAPETVQPLQDGHPGLLDHILGHARS